MWHRVTSTAAISKVRAQCVLVCVFAWETVWRHSNIFSCCSSCKRVIITHSVQSVFHVRIIFTLNYQFYTLRLPSPVHFVALFLGVIRVPEGLLLPLFSPASAVITPVSITLNQLLMNSLPLSLSLSRGAWRSNLQLNSHSFVCVSVCVSTMCVCVCVST